VKRRLVLLTCLLGFIGASVGTSMADVTKRPRNDVCIVLAQDDNGNVTKDLCITWPGVTPR
jgi:hypothetical protein